MYFVSAPAATCEDLPGITPDNASKTKQKADLKLVSSSSISPTRQSGGAEVAADILAAKILEMHAASPSAEQAACPPPKLIGEQEDPGFEMPGVLKRPDGQSPSSGLQPDQVPQPKTAHTVSASLRTGPSFKALLVSTFLVVSVGGIVGVFALSDPFGGETGTHTVATERITAEPTIESLIAADASTPTEQTSAATKVTATPEQIAKAKARIRDTFRESGRLAQTAADLARPLNSRQAQDDDKIQARLARPVLATEPTASPHASENAVRVASAGADPAAIVTDTQAKSVELQPIVAAKPSPSSSKANQGQASGPDLAAVPETPVSATSIAATSAAYPNSGRITASVNFRSTGDKDAEVLGVIPADTRISYDSCGTWWCSVTYEGQKGFVGQKYLERSQ